MHMQFIKVNNFKSLVDFKLDLAKFNCLVGLNGSGKSTVLQFIDFVGQQVRGHIDDWLGEREWAAEDIASKLTSQATADFVVSLAASTGEAGVTWEARFDPTKLQCVFERIVMPGGTLEVEAGHVRMVDLTIQDPDKREKLNDRVAFNYQGSILSQLDEEWLPESMLARISHHI